jgi:Transposase DDE domain group 1
LVVDADRVLGVISVLDSQVGRLKQRQRGLSVGETMVSMAESMLADGDFMCDLDVLRADHAGAALRAVPDAPAPTTFAAAARRFDDRSVAAVEKAMGILLSRWFELLPAARRGHLAATRPTIDLDGTDIEVYGSKKQKVEWNYAGQRVGRAHPASWAEAGVVLAADLGSGVDDPRPQAPGLIARAVANLPAGLGRPRVRCDAGYFDAKVARAALDNGCDFAIAAKRNKAVWRALAKVGDDEWFDAIDMPGAQVATCDYVPHGWPAGTRCVVRRVAVDPDQVRSDPRTRRRRTIAPAQLALALKGAAVEVYAYSFIVTNLAGDAEMIEYWFRERAWIEERHKESKLGLGLVHLPSGYFRVNQVWMWCAYLATNLSVFIQSLARLDTDGRAHAKRARRELFALPARVIRHARRTVIRFAPRSSATFKTALRRLRAIDSATPG